MTDLDPKMTAALDSLSPPPMTANFADRVMAATQMPPALSTPRRTKRGGWARRHGLALGIASFGLLSAAAAASGMLGESIQNLPVISVIAERVSPKPKPHPKLVVAPKQRPAAKVAPTAIAPLPLPVEPLVEPLPPIGTEVRREIIAQKFAERIARREAWRRKQGLAGPPRHLPPRLRERLRALPANERKALIERVRQIRQEQKNGSAPPPERADIIERAQRIRQLRQRRQEWFRRRAMHEPDMTEVIPPANEAPPQK